MKNKEDLTCIKADYCNCGGSRCKGKYHEKWCNSMKNKEELNIILEHIESMENAFDTLKDCCLQISKCLTKIIDEK